MVERFTIRTVHGTFAADEKQRDEGERWWQRGSKFSTDLLSYLGNDSQSVTLEPFHWTGHNSARDRFKAERRLAEKVLADARRPSEFVVHLCHSHGGNVFHSAGLRTARRHRLVPAGICVGTPFLPVTGLAELSGQRMFLPVRRRWAILVGALALILALWILPMPDVIAQATVWAASILLGAYYVMWLTTLNGRLSYRMMGVAGWIKERLPSYDPSLGSGTEQLFDREVRQANPFHPKIYSRLDEAINGLRNLPGQSVALATTGTAFAPVAGGLSLVVLIGLLALDAATQIIGPGMIADRAGQTWLWRDYAGDKVFSQAVEILVILILSGIGGLLLAALGGAWLGARVFNATLTGIVKQRGFGNDSALKSPVQYRADSNLPLFFGTYGEGEAWQPLPVDFDAAMKPVLDAQTSTALVRLREALAVSMSTGGVTILDAVKDSFSGNELVHTNYFTHPDFAPFIAYLLVEHHGFPASDRYVQIDRARYADWFSAIRAGAYVSRVEWARSQGWAGPFSGPPPAG